MNLAFKTIALIGRYQSPEVAQNLLRLEQFLTKLGAVVLVEAQTAKHINHKEFVAASYTQIGQQADLAVVMGGDGTMLNAARHLALHQVPLVGINQGYLGFMTDLALDDMQESMANLLHGEYTLERRTFLKAQIYRNNQRVYDGLGLNDAVVNKGAIGRMIEFKVFIDTQFIYDQRSDGLIISTPTGSTAYALSAGGPILHPDVSGFMLVPISPHALSSRPIVVSDQCKIEIVLTHCLEARVHFDGQNQFDLIEGDKVEISRAPQTIHFVHPQGHNYYAMLREKLHWSEAL